jgi:hypothetical protein
MTANQNPTYTQQTSAVPDNQAHTTYIPDDSAFSAVLAPNYVLLFLLTAVGQHFVSTAQAFLSIVPSASV